MQCGLSALLPLFVDAILTCPSPFTSSVFSTKFVTTIGVDYRDKMVKVEGAPMRLQLWDTAGQERFRSLTSNFFGRADGFVLCYDISNRPSFDHVIVCRSTAIFGGITKHTRTAELDCGNDFRWANFLQSSHMVCCLEVIVISRYFHYPWILAICWWLLLSVIET